MPFRNESEFTSETLEAMQIAYDSVVDKLKLKPDDARRGKLASLIVQLAKAGVYNSDRLADQARAGLN
jgi:hypothetical protein